MLGEPGKDFLPSAPTQPQQRGGILGWVSKFGRGQAELVAPTQPQPATEADVDPLTVGAEHLATSPIATQFEAIKQAQINANVGSSRYGEIAKPITGDGHEPLIPGYSVISNMTGEAARAEAAARERAKAAGSETSSVIPPAMSEADLHALVTSEAGQKVIAEADGTLATPITDRLSDSRRRLANGGIPTVTTAAESQPTTPNVAQAWAKVERGLDANIVPKEGDSPEELAAKAARRKRVNEMITTVNSVRSLALDIERAATVAEPTDEVTEPV